MMPPVYRLVEVAVYSILNFLPPLFLALYPFRDRLRFRLPGIFAMGLVLIVFQIASGFQVAFSEQSTAVISLLGTAVYAIFYFWVVKDHYSKMLFTLLMLSNITNLVVSASKCLEHIIFGQIALEPYRWTFSLCMAACYLTIMIPVFLYFRTWYTKGMAIQTGSKSGFWRFLWAIPATFYLVWFYTYYFSGKTSLEMALRPANTIFLFIINLGAFWIYHLVVRMVITQDHARTLEKQNHQLSIQKLQYDNLQERIDEARKAKHDVRHHVHLIREYLREGKIRELEEYLDSYQAILPDEQSIIYCDHYAANALLGYFVQQARENEIEMDVWVQLTNEIDFPETELSIVLGNLLENAVDACASMTEGEKKITVRGKSEKDAVFFEISNTYEGQLHQSKTGQYLSTKQHGWGLGLDSVSGIAEAHGGMLEIEAQNGIFRASVLLMKS